jgi:hypothetical protein
LENVADRLDKKLSAEYIKNMTLQSRLALLEKVAEEVVRICDPEVAGRIMHDSWAGTKRAQGYHHQSECYAMDRYESNGACPKCHSDLIPWEQLPEGQKDINRHAFDALLKALRAALDAAKEG